MPGPHPGDHSHRPPPGWEQQDNLHVSMHTSSPVLLQLYHHSTSTIATTLHKCNLSTQSMLCQGNANTVHTRSIPLKEKGCLCPSPTKPKTTTHSFLVMIGACQIHVDYKASMTCVYIFIYIYVYIHVKTVAFSSTTRRFQF